MSAKKLGRFTAGLFVALGLAFGGSLLAVAGDTGATPAANSAIAVTVGAQGDFEWG